MRSQLGKLLVVTLTVTAMAAPTSTAQAGETTFNPVVAPASKAQAARTEFNVQDQLLAATPTSPVPEGYHKRRIWLKGDVYGFYTHIKPNALGGDCQNRTGPIDEGWYTWEDWLSPQPHNGTYIHYSALLPDHAGDMPWIKCYNVRLPKDGMYTWGSALDPHF